MPVALSPFPFQQVTGGGGGGGAVSSVFGRVGDVVAVATDYAGIYVRLATADTVVARHTFNPAAVNSPFILGANAIDQLVTGLNADKLDGLDSSDFALAVHTHAASAITSGQLALARGGTGADLSATGGAGQFVKQDSAGGVFTVGTIGTTDLPTVPITKGGTGQITATAAFDALSPMTTLGDTIYGGALGTRTRLAGNTTTTRKWLRQTGDGAASAAPAWDVVADSDVTFADITTGNVSTAKHGYAPKAPNDATKYLDGTGAYSVPAGGGGGAFTSSGGIISQTTGTDRLKLIVGETGDVGLEIKGIAAQTADMLLITDSAGTTLAKFDKDGLLTLPNVTSPAKLINFGGIGQILVSSASKILLFQHADAAGQTAFYSSTGGQLWRFEDSGMTTSALLTLGAYMTFVGTFIQGNDYRFSDTTLFRYQGGSVVQFDGTNISFLKSQYPGLFRTITDSTPHARWGGTHYVDITGGGNVGGGEDTLITYTMPANLLEVNKQSFYVEFSGNFTNTGTVTKRVRVYYGSTVVFDTGALLFTNTAWRIWGRVYRLTATTQYAIFSFEGDSSLLAVTCQRSSPGETLSGTVVLKVTGLGGAGVADNDITADAGYVEFCPAN